MSTLVRTLINGVAADYIAVDDRSIQFGDGLFETMLVRDGRVIQLSEHLDRLTASAGRLAIRCPDRMIFMQDIDKLLKCSEHRDAVVKIILTRGSSSRGYQYDRRGTSRRIVRLSGVDTEHSSILSGELLHGDLCFCNTPATVNPALAGMKHLNRLESVLARNEFDDSRYIDGLMTDADGNVIEGSMSNLFAVSQGILYTPDLSRAGVAGVVRETILEIARDAGIEYSVCALTRAELQQMDCLFITNSLVGIKAVENLEDTGYRDFTLCDQLFDRLMSSLADTEVVL